jgi:hypothetical protein
VKRARVMVAVLKVLGHNKVHIGLLSSYSNIHFHFLILFSNKLVR